MSELTDLYNPANASALTNEQIEAMQKLTSNQIKELAQAYPNSVMQRPYLLIIENNKLLSKQIPQLSSFENLYNLRERNGMRQYVPFGFKGNYRPKVTLGSNKIAKPQVIDLSNEELLTLPGFKTATEEVKPEVVKVKKVKKQKIE